MCEYNSYQEEYPGDDFLHTTTVLNKKRVSVLNPYEGGVTYQQYVEQIDDATPGVPKRFCNDAVGSFKSHFHSMVCRKSHTQCAGADCGKGGAYWKCGICDKALHWSDPADKSVKRGSRGQKQNMVSCTLDYHDEMFFGLAKVDAHQPIRQEKIMLNTTWV
jgi:hypothetical protein